MNAKVIQKQVQKYMRYLAKKGLSHPENLVKTVLCTFEKNGRIHTARLVGNKWRCAATRNNFVNITVIKIELRINGLTMPLFA